MAGNSRPLLFSSGFASFVPDHQGSRSLLPFDQGAIFFQLRLCFDSIGEGMHPSDSVLPDLKGKSGPGDHAVAEVEKQGKPDGLQAEQQQRVEQQDQS